MTQKHRLKVKEPKNLTPWKHQELLLQYMEEDEIMSQPSSDFILFICSIFLHELSHLQAKAVKVKYVSVSGKL